MDATQTILLVGAGLLGLIVGSFLNALSFRFNTGQPFFSKRGMGGRSRCMHCGHELSSLDLVPVFSFLFLGGKCRYCGAKISWQYPLVEVTAAALSVLIFLQVSKVTPSAEGVTLLVGFIFWFVVWMTLLFIVIYDIKHTIIPWSCSILLALLGFCSLFCNLHTLQFAVPGIWLFLAGPLLALPLFLLSLVSGGTWMGWGDSELELGLGWLLAASVGISAGVTAFMLAFWIGAGVGVVLLLLSHAGIFGYTIKSEIPFAPFLVLGAVLAYFFHVDFFSTISTLL
ncbi:MAG TPA: prepilin peptidase [Candidatus Paceibacterota bacterium]|nr:prepilin peptidase [Candidatus Paceibacterota bacterium]